MCICQLWAPFSTQYVHPNTSISSPSGAGRSALLSDWAHAVAHQGGVKAARMFHIHTKLEFIISPSGYGVPPAGELYSSPDFVKQLSLFASWRKDPANHRFPSACVMGYFARAGFQPIRSSGLACLQDRWSYGWGWRALSHHYWPDSDLHMKQAVGLNPAEEGVPLAPLLACTCCHDQTKQE